MPINKKDDNNVGALSCYMRLTTWIKPFISGYWMERTYSIHQVNLHVVSRKHQLLLYDNGEDTCSQESFLMVINLIIALSLESRF